MTMYDYEQLCSKHSVAWVHRHFKRSVRALMLKLQKQSSQTNTTGHVEE